MPYYMRITDAGITREVEKWQRPSQRRAAGEQVAVEKMEKPSPEEVARINRLGAIRALRQVINANFGAGYLWVTLTYRKGEEVTHEAALAEHYPKLIRRLRTLYERAGIPFSYLAVTEQRRNRRPHHHLILPEAPLSLIREAWGYGNISAKPMDRGGQHHQLALYIIEHSDCPERVGNRWRCSKGLKRPQPSRTTQVKAKSWRISVPNGWRLCNIVEPEQGVNPYTGEKYLRYTIIKIGKKGAPP